MAGDLLLAGWILQAWQAWMTAILDACSPGSGWLSAAGWLARELPVTAGLAGWVAGGQGSTGQKVWLPSRPTVAPTRRLVAWNPRGCRLGRLGARGFGYL